MRGEGVVFSREEATLMALQTSREFSWRQNLGTTEPWPGPALSRQPGGERERTSLFKARSPLALRLVALALSLTPLTSGLRAVPWPG